MGSEVVFVLIPLGALLLAFLSYRAAHGPERIYPFVALATCLVAGVYIAAQGRSGYLMWFPVWFALVSTSAGAAAHVTRWLVQRTYTANAENENVA